MGAHKNSSNKGMKEIPLNIKIPKTIKSNPNSKFFIHLPNETFELSGGKNFESGFWSISKEELKNTKIIAPSSKVSFQFLLINKNSTEDEIASNVYYKNGELLTGPLISADYILNPEEINIKIKSFSPDTSFEIEGLPKVLTLSKGGKITSEIWELTESEAQDLTIKIPTDFKEERLHLTITGNTKEYPHLKTHFNLIINLNENKTPHQTKYKEITIPAENIIKKSKIKCSRASREN